jgi:hypothetical protein
MLYFVSHIGQPGNEAALLHTERCIVMFVPFTFALHCDGERTKRPWQCITNCSIETVRACVASLLQHRQAEKLSSRGFGLVSHVVHTVTC